MSNDDFAKTNPKYLFAGFLYAFPLQTTSEEMSESLLLAAVGHMSLEAVETLAIRYLGVKHPQIQTIAAADRDDITTRKIKVLQSWLTRYTGPDAKEELHKTLVKAAADGIVPREAHQCLVQQKSSNSDEQVATFQSRFKGECNA